jgi:chemosensory pili system protein ChpA (sensor histidine kinase/response regulator)
MMLEGSNSSSAIGWVREDLDICLDIIREKLEIFAENTEQQDTLQAVQQQLERLNLTFMTMEQQGASILTDEMMAVGSHMLHNGNANYDETLNALTDAVIVLPSYLDRLQAGHEDLPILLLPTLNELRATHDESLLSEGTLFAPELDVIIAELSGSEADHIAESDFPGFAKRVRGQYQGALLGWLKEQSRDALLEPMQQVCRTLYIRLGRNGLRRLWWIADLAMQGLRDGAIDNDLPLRRLFARLDLTLKAMTEGGEEGPGNDTITALSRALLFYAAQARPGSKGTDLLRERFKLDELIPDRDALLRARGAVTGRDAGLFESIGEAVREELAQVKDTLDMELRTGRVDAEQRAHSKASLRQLADTLGMLNLPVPAKAVEGLLPALEETDGVTNMDLDSPLLGLAQKLLEVESVLATHIQLLGEPVEEQPASGTVSLPPQEQRQILSSMLDECVTTLHEVQEAIHKRLQGDTGADFSSGLILIEGALSVSTQKEVASLTGKLERTLNAALAGLEDGGEAKVDNLIPLSDAVAALELYLTGCRDDQSGNRRFLDIMNERLSGLPEAASSGEKLPETEVVLPAAPVEEAAAPAPEQAEAATAQIDPTMLGIFLDEFDTVHAQLEDQLADWLDNTSDSKALGEVRRAFHTLKGSGRMVGAMEIGDFAWRYEELLNSLIESRIEFSQSMAHGLTLAAGALNSLRDRLVGEDSDLTSEGIRQLSNFARQLSSGNMPDPEALSAHLPASLMLLITDADEGEADLSARAAAAAAAEKAAADTADAPTEDAAEKAAEAEQPAESSAQELPSIEETLETGSADPALVELMVGEIRGHLAELEVLAVNLAEGRKCEANAELVRAAHTLAGNFAMAPLGQESDVARAMENYLEGCLRGSLPVTPAALEPLQGALHRFRQRLYTLESGNEACYPLTDDELISQISGLAEVAEPEAPAEEAVSEQQAEVSEQAAADQTPVEEPGTEAATEETAPATAATAIEVEEGSIIAIFLEEATEVLERCDTLLNTWRDKLGDQKLVENLQREIHTFKGGARMAGLEDLGTLAHSMETLLENIATHRVEATIAAVQALEEGCDSLNLSVEQILSGRMPDPSAALARFEKRVGAIQAPGDEPETAAPQAETPAVPEPPVAEEVPAVGKPDTEEPAVAAPQAAKPEQEIRLPARKIKRKAADKDRGKRKDTKREFREIEDRPAAAAEDTSGSGQIRVAADLMDKLVNYAGEVSIYRSRLEQQMGSVRANLKDVDITVQRLKEQLRKMDMEAEAQIMSRYQSASTQNSSEFDPLELDRFSNMQQLSRSLSESVSDLLNLHEMLDESVRHAETLLTQQSRVSSDLQEGLMQTRMTPFGSAAPRLRRVVRSAAAETGKKARLQLRMAGSSDQLDRNVLERITAPLEHMLRNAIAHGIEVPKVRKKAKKPEEGSITVTVEAEATEFVIRVHDDGAGVDLDAVRKRAIERGMLGENEQIDDRELVQFIRRSGFSTAESVTGLSGRGVGMDVVNSEIKQIGGSMEIESKAGKGSEFIIRIPFSLAVMQAIAVSVGDRVFQIPLNSVAGVARMTPSEYSALLASESPSYEFAGQEYPLLELEPLLDAPVQPLDSDNVSLLMISSGEHVAAFRVSNLQGHQEVVIKPVGPQISSIPGILGGTIAADGQVMLILDMGPLIRRGLESATLPAMPEPEKPQEDRTPLVMVVDDSITMRKVTSRVLENHSLDVLTAQDGLDAVEKLHDTVPDLMLLDIEMPRMDGYELLEHVRADARLRHVPIVMITSRAGQKHRKKARAAGANDYLTKPYQEPELVDKVSELLDMELTPRRAD